MRSLIRLIFWMLGGIMLNGYFPFETAVSIGEVTYGPASWSEVSGRAFNWVLVVIAGEMILWVRRNFSTGKSNKTS